MKRSIRKLLSLFIRRSAVGDALLDNMPCNVRFLDGQCRVAPRRTMKLFKTWEYHPELRVEKKAAFAAYQGGDFIDVGAFHGWYSLMLAPKAGEKASFISIEPDSRALPVLYHSMALIKKHFPHVSTTVIDCPAGRGESYHQTFPAGESGHPAFTNSKQISIGPISLTIDQIVSVFNLEPKFIKIDVEGAEGDVLDGMLDTLARFMPCVMLEIHPMWLPAGLSIDNLLKPLVDSGYSCSPITELKGIWNVKAL